MHKEHRAFTRLALHAGANMHYGERSLEANVENLSLKGAFVATATPLGLDDVVLLTIDNTLARSIKAKVVRVTDQGMGLEFEKTLLD